MLHMTNMTTQRASDIYSEPFQPISQHQITAAAATRERDDQRVRDLTEPRHRRPSPPPLPPLEQ